MGWLKAGYRFWVVMCKARVHARRRDSGSCLRSLSSDVAIARLFVFLSFCLFVPQRCTTNHNVPFPPPLCNAANSMNSLRFNRSSKQAFRKPLDFLSNLSRSGVQLPPDHDKKTDQRPNLRASSLDDSDSSDVEYYAQMEGRRSHSAHNSQSELQPPVPLMDVGSRSTSPYPRIRSAVQSEDEDDEYEAASSIRPLVGRGAGRGGNAKRGMTSQGGLGYFLFSTWTGWQVWVGLLVFWVGGCSFGLLLMNRFIMLTGVYK